MNEIEKLLYAQQSLAEVVASGIALGEDLNELRYILHVIPGIIKRIEEA